MHVITFVEFIHIWTQPTQTFCTSWNMFFLFKMSFSSSWNSDSAAIAQLVARGSHNPKVVSSILTGRICLFLYQSNKKYNLTNTIVHILCSNTSFKHICACRESNPGHKHGRLVWYRYTTCAWRHVRKLYCKSWHRSRSWIKTFGCLRMSVKHEVFAVRKKGRASHYGITKKHKFVIQPNEILFNLNTCCVILSRMIALLNHFALTYQWGCSSNGRALA